MTGGSHLGVIREWIKRKAFNGEGVLWGSHQILKLGDVSVYDLEYLAQQIRNAIVRDIKKEIKICDNFYPDFQSDNFGICENCGQRRHLHELLEDDNVL